MRKIIWPAISYVHFLLTEYKIEVLLCALQVPGQLFEIAGIFRGGRYAMHDCCVFLFIYCLFNRHGRGIIYSCGFCDGRCQRHLEIHQWIFEIKKHQLKIMKHLSIVSTLSGQLQSYANSKFFHRLIRDYTRLFRSMFAILLIWSLITMCGSILMVNDAKLNCHY